MNTNQQAMLPIGTMLHDTYRVEKHLSSGGFGNTYVVINVQFEEQLALKEFFMKGINQREGQTTVSVSNAENREQFASQLEKFKKEARRLRKLENENIVRVHDLFEENGTAYYVMDLIDGESLSARMKRLGRPLTEPEVMALLPQVINALDGMHAQQLWHLDLKPGNVMVDRQGRAVLIDFGASKQMDVTSQGYTGTSSAMCYTPGFAPTEQIDGSLKLIGPWTDFYAFGATIYNLLTRQQPPSAAEIMMDGVNAFQFPASVSDDLRMLVVWLMNARPASRPQSAAAIRQRIKEELKAPEEAEEVTSLETQLHESPTPKVVLTPKSNEQGMLTIVWNGMWMLIDTKIRIKANGMEVGSFSFKKGFKVTIPITDNRIFLDVKFSIRSYQPILPVDPAKNYTLTLNYSRVTGGFKFCLFDENGPLLRL